MGLLLGLEGGVGTADAGGDGIAGGGADGEESPPLRVGIVAKVADHVEIFGVLFGEGAAVVGEEAGVYVVAEGFDGPEEAVDGVGGGGEAAGSVEVEVDTVEHTGRADAGEGGDGLQEDVFTRLALNVAHLGALGGFRRLVGFPHSGGGAF